MTNKHEIYVAKSIHNREVVVIDLDGVLADFCFSYTQYLSKTYGKPEYPLSSYEVTPGDLTDLGFEKEHKEAFWKWCYEQDSFWLNLREMEPGMVDKLFWAVNETDGRQYTVYFCTTREDGKKIPVQMESYFWLQKYGWEDPNVVVSDRKGEFCHAVRANIFLDDKFDNCKQVCEQSPDTEVYWLALPAQRYYLEESKKYNMKIIYHLDEFINELKCR